MTAKVTFKNKSLTLVGRNIKLMNEANNFKATTNDLKEVTLFDFKNKIKIINSFPSLDTHVCDLQVKEFNKKALELSDDIVLIPISKDLPFAQKRFCESFNIKNINVLSDYKTSSFGINYGLLIKELNLLARSAIILDQNNIIRYIQIVPEITDSLDFDDVFKNLTKVLKNKNIEKKSSKEPIKCIPCEGRVKPLSKEEIKKELNKLNSWQLEDKKIIKDFLFKDFLDAKYFLDLLAVIANEQNHHPNFLLSYNKLKVILSTHAIESLSLNDFIMAKIIDDLKR